MAVFVSSHAATWVVANLTTRILWTVSTMFQKTAVAQTLHGSADTASSPNADVLNAADNYRQAVLAGDAGAAAAVYSEDGIELPSHFPLVRGRAAIEQRLQQLFKEVKVTAFTFSHIETRIDGNVAYDAGTYEQRLSLPSGQTLTDVGKYLAILRRSQGEWKAAYIMYNSNAPALPCPMRQ
jgi:uncharacterized protein (TIGR02246 family)